MSDETNQAAEQTHTDAAGAEESTQDQSPDPQATEAEEPRTALAGEDTEAQDGEGANAGDKEPTDWKAALPEEMRESLKDFESVEDLAKAFAEAKAERDVPESYEFNVPEESKELFDQSVADSFSEVAKEQGLTQKQLDRLLQWDMNRTKVLAESYQEKLEAGMKGLQAEWGARFNENLGLAKKGMRADIVPDDLRKDLTENPAYGNHPGLIKLLAAIGERLDEDSFSPAGKPGGRSTDAATVIYGNSHK